MGNGGAGCSAHRYHRHHPVGWDPYYHLMGMRSASRNYLVFNAQVLVGGGTMRYHLPSLIRTAQELTM
jgi:hypothetical protein